MSNYDDHDDFYGESMDYRDYLDDNVDLDTDEDDGWDDVGLDDEEIEADETFWQERDPWSGIGDEDS